MGLQSNEVVMVRSFSKYLIPVCLILFILPASALAIETFEIFPKGGVKLDDGEMRWGRILLHPGFAFRTTYNDNVFRGADKTFVNGSFETRQEDVYFSNKPSLGVELQRGAGEVFGFYFDYKGEDQHFRKLGRFNAFNHDISGWLNFGGPGGRADITIGGRYDKSNNLNSVSLGGVPVTGGGVPPVGSIGNSDLQSNIGNRIAVKTTEGFMDVIYALSKIFKLKFRADATVRDFGGTSSAQNVNIYNFGGSFFWQATSVVAYGIKYNHRMRDFDTVAFTTNDNLDTDQVYLAMKWKPTKLIFTDIAVGFNTKRFDHSSGEDRQDFLYQIYAEYKPVERTIISMRAYREILDSSFQTLQSYAHTSVQAKLVQKLGRKFKIDFSGRLQNRDYGRSIVDLKGGGIVRKRIDNRFTGSVGLVYEIQKWLQARAGYRYRQVFSNFDDKDFRSNIGTLEIAAKY